MKSVFGFVCFQASTWLPTTDKAVHLPNKLSVTLRPSDSKGLQQLFIGPETSSEYMNVNPKGKPPQLGQGVMYMNFSFGDDTVDECAYMNTEEARQVCCHCITI